MADHQPGLGPEHRQMVAHGLGVGRTDADVDQCNARPAGRHQVIGRHLMFAPGSCRNGGFRVRSIGGDHHVARRRQGGVGAARLQLRGSPAHELIHIAVIVREQDVLLGVFGWRAGIVGQARQ